MVACGVLKELSSLAHPFFFGVLSAGLTGGYGFGGVEGVVDVYDEQVLMFWYANASISLNVGISGAPTRVSQETRVRERGRT